MAGKTLYPNRTVPVRNNNNNNWWQHPPEHIIRTVCLILLGLCCGPGLGHCSLAPKKNNPCVLLDNTVRCKIRRPEITWSVGSREQRGRVEIRRLFAVYTVQYGTVPYRTSVRLYLVKALPWAESWRCRSQQHRQSHRERERQIKIILYLDR